MDQPQLLRDDTAVAPKPRPPLPGPRRHDLDANETACLERMLLVKAGCAVSGSEVGVALADALISEFCRYLAAVHGLPRTRQGYSVTGDTNQGYALEPTESLPAASGR
jgi:hypothetical protein